MKKILKLSLCLALLFALLSTFNACKPEPEQPIIIVTTNSVTNITETSAKCSGSVTATGYTVGECGLCWSETGNPTIDDDRTTDQIGTGSFVSTISGLKKNTKYYVKAYATTSIGTLYGEEKSFTTEGVSDPTGYINGYAYVDLGLPSGTKWATLNVGASAPEVCGNYYAWGVTETFNFYDGSTTVGVQINDFSGNAQYDVAKKEWGDTWRMPTKTEVDELNRNCVCTWTTQGGINGLKITGLNGNTIFLPAAGAHNHEIPEYIGSVGHYWTSTPCYNNDYDVDNSYCFAFSYNDNDFHVDLNYRDCGKCIRPVSD